MFAKWFNSGGHPTIHIYHSRQYIKEKNVQGQKQSKKIRLIELKKFIEQKKFLIKMKKKTVLLILFIATFAHGNPLVNDDEGVHNIEITMIRKMDELKKLPSIKIYEDIVTIEKLDDDKIIQTSDEHLEDPLIERINNFLNTRKIQIRLPNDGSTADLFGRALGKKNIDIQLNSLTRGASEGEFK